MTKFKNGDRVKLNYINTPAFERNGMIGVVTDAHTYGGHVDVKWTERSPVDNSTRPLGTSTEQVGNLLPATSVVETYQAAVDAYGCAVLAEKQARADKERADVDAKNAWMTAEAATTARQKAHAELMVAGNAAVQS
jgi:hypothetical protein